MMLNKLAIKTPRDIVSELNKHIIGQNSAKRAVAIALRNRYRRRFVPEEFKNEITPKNILMIGSTGVGKTEIARRLAKLDNAPFIKVEATKFTEIGYVGRDVESIIRDLVDIAVKLVQEEEISKVSSKALFLAEEKILNILLSDRTDSSILFKTDDIKSFLKKKLQSGELNDKEIEINIVQEKTAVDFLSFPGMEGVADQFNNILNSLSSEKKKKRIVNIKDALKILKEEESSKLINFDNIKFQAIDRVEQSGIVFLDELDKIAQRSDKKVSTDVSREGVQRDLLPLIEGSNVMTKYGIVKTDYILFIASGAFHISKPSDLIPELQGRLPIKVKLDSLTTDDFIKILLEPDYSIVKQYKELLKVEGVNLVFSDDSIISIAQIANDINEYEENIGARRLHTVMEKLLDNILFEAGHEKNFDFLIDSDYVYKCLKDLNYVSNLDNFIL